MNLASVLEESFERYPERVALIDGTRRCTYAGLDALASGISQGLRRQGVQPGEVVALSAPNSIEFVAAYYGVLKAGAVVLPLSTMLREEEIAAQLRFTGAVAYLCHGGTEAMPLGAAGAGAYEQARETCRFFCLLSDSPHGVPSGLDDLCSGAAEHVAAMERADGDTAIISFTSGTTASPKAACISHGAQLACSRMGRNMFGYGPEDRVLTFIPLFTSIAQCLIQEPVLSAGGSMVLQKRFDASAALDAVAAEAATVVVGVPTVYYRFCEELNPRNYESTRSHWRLAVYGGSSITPEVHARFTREFGVPLKQAYGLTETRVVASSPPEDYAALVPGEGVVFRVVDEEMRDVPPGEKGQLIMQSPTVMDGYLQNLEQTRAVFRDGWFLTGDIVTRSEQEWYYITGRSKEIISRASFKVYPAEVEAVLRECPGVKEAAVLGVPHAEHGEEVAAVVVMQPGMELDGEAVVAWGKKHLPPYGYPRLVKVLPALPVTPTGKVKKQELVQLFV